MKKKYIQLLIILLSILLWGCGENREIFISGKTMGTTYHITVLTEGFFQSTSGLKEKIDTRLKAINQSMSTYIKTSEISRFNALNNTEEKFHISADFLQVMKAAKNLHQQTHGAWDGTVNPLVNLWGFGKSGKRDTVPNSPEIASILEKIGFEHIEISDQGFLRKKKAAISLDLASIAKGYGVDQISALIQKSGFKNFIVEIGGEIYASGLRKDGKPWQVGINTPQKNAAYHAVYKIVGLTNQGFATSGDYRNFFEADGMRYSHVLDPRTGYPVSNRVVSVSIMAKNCTFADGLATAVMVMGREKGLELINQLDTVECLIIVQEKDGSLSNFYSKAFQRSEK